MARYVDALDVPRSLEEAFDYLADFSRTAEWDPGVVEARRLTPGEVRLGSAFEVTVSFLGQRIPLQYRITEFERPSRLVLSGGNSSLRSVDEITFVSRPGGTRVTLTYIVVGQGLEDWAGPVDQVIAEQVSRYQSHVNGPDED